MSQDTDVDRMIGTVLTTLVGLFTRHKTSSMSMKIINEEIEDWNGIFGLTFPHVLSLIDGIFAAMILVCKLKHLSPIFEIYGDDKDEENQQLL